MSVHPTTRTRSRDLAIAGSIIASLAFTGVASAEELTVTRVEGNPNCSALGADHREIRVDPVRQGHTVFGAGTTSGSIDVKGAYFDFSVTPGVDAVVVKGGPTANVYRGSDEVTSGTGLHAPPNGDGRPYGLSHISFCTDDVDSAPRPSAPPPGPCEPGGPAVMPDGTPCGAPATGTPAPGTQTEPAQGAPARGEVRGVRAGSPRPTAQMSGPRACVSRSYVQVVRGTGIRKVTVFVNGRKVRTFAGGLSRYALAINPRAYRGGVMRVKARVVYSAARGRRAQTLRMTVLRCASGTANSQLGFAG